jgi:hypothetical protein
MRSRIRTLRTRSKDKAIDFGALQPRSPEEAAQARALGLQVPFNPERGGAGEEALGAEIGRALIEEIAAPCALPARGAQAGGVARRGERGGWPTRYRYPQVYGSERPSRSAARTAKAGRALSKGMASRARPCFTSLEQVRFRGRVPMRRREFIGAQPPNPRVRVLLPSDARTAQASMHGRPK